MVDLPFCVLPWFHQVVNTDGDIRPCCIWRSSTNELDTKRFLYSEFMHNLRDQFKQGIPHAECSQCTYEESNNNLSIRQSGFDTLHTLNINFEELETTQKFNILSQDVRLSNVCNLKCRMCGQTRSTNWITDAVALGEEPIGLLESNWSLSDDQVLTVSRLRFPGGEPMMHQDVIINEVSKIKDAGRLHLVDLHFTTNMTVKIEPELIALIIGARETSIGCSIDGVSDMNDYIRSNSHWCDVVENTNILNTIHKEHPHVVFGLNPVFNAFNVEEFDKLVDWGQQFNSWIIPSLQHKPMMQDARNLPDDYKADVIERYEICKHEYPLYIDKFNSIISHLKNERTMEYTMWKRYLRRHNKFLDKRRHTTLATVNPRLASIIYE